jgi:hypothetical protein
MISYLKTYPKVWLLVIYCISFSAITYLVQFALLTDTIFHNTYAEQLSFDRVEQMIEGQNKWAWLSFAILPILYSIKFFLVACCLLTGSIFFDIKLKFGEAFKIALLADMVFVIPLIIKLFWFLFVQKNYTLLDLQLFSPLSALNLLNTENIEMLWFYPLQLLNIFELLYIFSLGYWVYQFGAKSFEKGLNMVLGSYVPALFIWVILIMFITLNLNPLA